MKKASFCLMLLVLLLIVAPVSAEYARVLTPGGPLKLRKGPSQKKQVVCEVPNHSIVEITEAGEEWTCITYGKKTGYIMTKFLHLPGKDGSATITLSNTPVILGEETAINVAAEDAVSYRYNVTLGKTTYKGVSVPYPTVYYRPENPGIACIEVYVTDSAGKETQSELFFEVLDAVEGEVNDITVPEVYSQRDGWWLNKKYGSSTLSESGCAIFTLSHALKLMGYTGDEILPEALAKEYRGCLVDGGTLNASLIGRSAKAFGFTTHQELIKNKSTIIDDFEKGCLFTFSVVKGHIALAAGLNEDKTKVLIYDSVPSVTLERIQDAKLYTQNSDGTYSVITDLSKLPEAKYYFVTDSFNGMKYYLDLDYVAKRGVRLIKPGTK